MSRYRRAMQRARRRERGRPPQAVTAGPTAGPTAAASTSQRPPQGIDGGLVEEGEDWKVEAVAELPLRCLLCNGPEAVRGFFSPDDQRRVHAPEGQSRLRRYSLCARCSKDPSALRRGVVRLFAGVAAMARVN